MMTREEQNWKLLFSSFLNTPVDELDFHVTLTDKAITITTHDVARAQLLKSVLSSPETAHAGISYSLTEPGQANAVAYDISYPQVVSVEHGMGKDLYENIFGKKAIEEIGRIGWLGEVDREDCFVLHAACEANYAELVEAQVKTYQRILAQANFADLRHAFATNKEDYAPLPDGLNKKNILAPHVDKIIYIKTDKQQNKTIYFDFGLLASCIVAPKMEIQPLDNDNKFELKIDKNHFINYLSVLFEEGFVLNIKDNQALPICFNMQRAIRVENVITLLLDRSISMGSVFSILQQKVLGFITKIVADPNYENSTIRLRPFADYYEPGRDFILSSANLPSIVTYVNSLIANGNGTAIRDSINTVLTNLRQDIENNTVIIFTDGEDNSSARDSLDKLRENTDLLKSAKNPPKIYTLGLGNTLDEKMLRELATITGESFIPLVRMEDFAQIEEHLQAMGKVRSLTHFVEALTQQKFVVPAYANDISVSPNALTVPGNFTVDGKEYTVQKGGLQLLPAPQPAQVPPAKPDAIDPLAALQALLANYSDQQRQELFAKFLTTTQLPLSSAHVPAATDTAESKAALEKSHLAQVSLFPPKPKSPTIIPTPAPAPHTLESSFTI